MTARTLYFEFGSRFLRSIHLLEMQPLEDGLSINYNEQSVQRLLKSKELITNFRIRMKLYQLRMCRYFSSMFVQIAVKIFDSARYFRYYRNIIYETNDLIKQ